MAEVQRISDRLENSENQLRASEWLMARRHLGRNARSLLHAADMPTRLQILVWTVLVAIAIALSLHAFQAYQFGTHFDDAHYVILTQSLIRSDQYGMIHRPGQPGLPRYPFGYPLLLAPFALVFPGNLDALKALSLIATVTNAALLFWGWRWFSRRSHWWALAIVGLYVLSPLAIDHTRRVMSEPIFTTFCLIAILLAEQAAQGTHIRLWAPALASALTFVLFTRTIGLVLLISVFAYLLLVRGRGFWKKIALIVALMALLTTLLVWMTPVQSGNLWPSKYLREADAHWINASDHESADGSGDRPVSREMNDEDNQPDTGQLNLKSIIAKYVLPGIRFHLGEDVRSAILPFGAGLRGQAFAENIGLPFLPILIGFLISGVVIFGFTRWLTLEGLTAFNLFAILYSVALFAWVWTGPRLLYPIQPPLQFAFLLGTEATLIGVTAFRKPKGSLPRLRNGALALVVIILMLTSAYKSLTIEDSRLLAGDIEARSSWIKANTPPSAVIMTEAPSVDYVYSGRKAVYYPTPGSASELEDYITNQQVDYILVAPRIKWMKEGYVPSYRETMTQTLPLLQALAAENRIKLVYSSEQELIKVFETQYEQ